MKRKSLGKIKLEIDVEDMLYNADIDWNYKIPTVIQNEVSNQIRALFKNDIEERIKEEVKNCFENVQSIIGDNIMDFEYKKCYSANEMTTPRQEIGDKIQKMVGDWKDTRYDSDKSAWQRGVEKAVSQEIDKFKIMFNADVVAKVTQQAKEHATNEMKRLLGIK